MTVKTSWNFYQFKMQKMIENARAAPGFKEGPQQRHRVAATRITWADTRNNNAPVANPVAMSEVYEHHW